MCHCGLQQSCHADVLVSAFTKTPGAFGRDDIAAASDPSSEQQTYFAELREEQSSSGVSSADEGARPSGTGWTGTSKPMQVGVGYPFRDLCDGQSLASPGRWPMDQRRYPQSDTWSEVAALVKKFGDHHGTTKLLMEPALGRVEKNPFPVDAVQELEQQTVSALASRGLPLNRLHGDRDALPFDFRFIDLLLRASEDPEVRLGGFAQGVKVGRGTRMPRHPALYRSKWKWRLEQQRDPTNWQEEEKLSESPWRQNNASLVCFADKVEAVLEDQAFGITSASYYWNRVGQQWAESHSAKSVTQRRHGTCSSQTTTTSKQVGEVQIRPHDVVHRVCHHRCSLVVEQNGRGGTVTWVGFELLHRTRQLGISQIRAYWFRKWTTEVASSRTVHMASFEEGIGGVVYVAGALEYERLFLGPLYNFLSLHLRDSVRTVLLCVSFSLKHLAGQIAQCRHHDCAMKMYSDHLAPRVDAQASAGRTGIGEWFLHVDQSVQIDVKASRWFSHEITRDEWPRVFEKSSKPALIISTLEALAVLVACSTVKNSGETAAASPLSRRRQTTEGKEQPSTS